MNRGDMAHGWCDTREGNNMTQHNNGAGGSNSGGCSGSPGTPQVTSSSFMATQLLRGKPWSMGTRNWRHPDQWPTSSIMQIRLKMRMNTLAMFRNWKGKGQLLVCSVLTFSSLIETQQSLGKPWSIGTRNWRQPDQWPIRSIIQIRLNILINTPIEFNNWKHS